MTDAGGTATSSAAFVERLGPWALARPAPHTRTAVAAAGCSLVVLGALLIGGDRLPDGGGGSQLPGLVLSAAVVAMGYVLLARTPAGTPLATAGTVAAALGVPPLLFFLTFDRGGLPPYSADAILLVSTAAWAVSYLAGPGRGRPFFLGAAAIGLWLAVLQQAEQAFDVPFLLLGTIAVMEDEVPLLPFFGAPDPDTLAGLSLAFGAAYLVAARRLDQQGYAGIATPFTVASLVALPAGVVFLADELEPAGAGIVGAVVGAVVAAHGASVGRRATTWLGAAGVAYGLTVFVGDLVDEPTPAGFVLMAIGVGVVVATSQARLPLDGR